VARLEVERKFADMEWPKGPGGEPEAPALLLNATDQQKLFETQMFLDAMGIAYLTQNPNPTVFTNILFGTNINGGFLYVPESMLTDAQELLNNPPQEADQNDGG
jgi:hypothetical protein